MKTTVRYPPRGTRDEGMGEISGFGGGYEAACWGGLRAGLKWLDEHPTWKFKENTGLYDKREQRSDGRYRRGMRAGRGYRGDGGHCLEPRCPHPLEGLGMVG